MSLHVVNGSNSDEQCRLYDRIVAVVKEDAERKEETKEALGDLKKEGKGKGFSDMRMKALIKLARRELESDAARAKRLAEAEETDLANAELGAFKNTPLGRHADRAQTHVGAMAG